MRGNLMKRVAVSWDSEGYTSGENAPKELFIGTKEGYKKWKKEMAVVIK